MTVFSNDLVKVRNGAGKGGLGSIKETAQYF